MRERSTPRHSKPPCGVAWCVDPDCGVSLEVQRPWILRELLTELGQELLAERSARLASRPRRVATRFGLSLLAALTLSFGVSALPAGTSGDSPQSVPSHPHVVASSLLD